MGLPIGENGDWWEPKQVPRFEDEQEKARAREKAEQWHGISDHKLVSALQTIEALPDETKTAVSDLVSVLQNRMWIILDRKLIGETESTHGFL